MEASWQRVFSAPAPRQTCLLWGQMARFTLPRGPVESTSLWYANSRLGVAVVGVYLWGVGLGENGEWLVYVSRVVEKGG
eukprot:5251566-Lingulodinium_polyedra.AAC.1